MMRCLVLGMRQGQWVFMQLSVVPTIQGVPGGQQSGSFLSLDLEVLWKIHFIDIVD